MYGQDTPLETLAEVQLGWEEFKRQAQQGLADIDWTDGEKRIYNTSEVARFFGKSTQWVYWGLTARLDGTQPFSYRNGDPIRPERGGRMNSRLFTMPLIREIALSCFRRNTLTQDELEDIMGRILIAEFGRHAFADE